MVAAAQTAGASANPQIYGAPFPAEYLGKDEQLVLSLRPKLISYISLTALIATILSLVFYATAVLIVTGLFNSAVSGTATLSSVSGALGYLFLFWFIAWVAAIVGAAAWGNILPGGIRALMAVAAALLVPYIFFDVFFSSLPSVYTVSQLSSAFWLSYAVTALVVVAFALLLPILFAYLTWRHTFYGMTNRRAIKVSGIIGRFARDATYEKIQGVTLAQGVWGRMMGFGSVVFATASTSGGSFGLKAERQGLGILWWGVPNPVDVRARANEVSEEAQKRLKVAEFQQMASVFRAQGVAPPTGPMAPPGPGPSAPAMGMGGAASASTSGQRFCTQCGTPNPPLANFCSGCARPLG